MNYHAHHVEFLRAIITDFDGQALCHVRAPHPGHDIDLFKLIAARLRDEGHDLNHNDILWGEVLTEAEAGTHVAFDTMPYYDFANSFP